MSTRRTDVLEWRRPKKPAPTTALPSVAELLKIKTKVEALAEGVEKAAKRAETERLREHISTFPLPPPEGQRALHLRVADPGMERFLELVEQTGKRIGKK